MKKLYLLAGTVLFFVGCASNQPTTAQKVKTGAKEAVQAVVDPCEREKLTCLANCKMEYTQEDWKYKACVAKCYTVYGACKTGKAVKKGYEKTKEYIEEKLN